MSNLPRIGRKVQELFKNENINDPIKFQQTKLQIEKSYLHKYNNDTINQEIGYKLTECKSITNNDLFVKYTKTKNILKTNKKFQESTFFYHIDETCDEKMIQDIASNGLMCRKNDKLNFLGGSEFGIYLIRNIDVLLKYLRRSQNVVKCLMIRAVCSKTEVLSYTTEAIEDPDQDHDSAVPKSNQIDILFEKDPLLRDYLKSIFYIYEVDPATTKCVARPSNVLPLALLKYERIVPTRMSLLNINMADLKLNSNNKKRVFNLNNQTTQQQQQQQQQQNKDIEPQNRFRVIMANVNQPLKSLLKKNENANTKPKKAVKFNIVDDDKPSPVTTIQIPKTSPVQPNVSITEPTIVPQSRISFTEYVASRRSQIKPQTSDIQLGASDIDERVPLASDIRGGTSTQHSSTIDRSQPMTSMASSVIETEDVELKSDSEEQDTQANESEQSPPSELYNLIVPQTLEQIIEMNKDLDDNSTIEVLVQELQPDEFDDDLDIDAKIERMFNACDIVTALKAEYSHLFENQSRTSRLYERTGSTDFKFKSDKQMVVELQDIGKNKNGQEAVDYEEDLVEQRNQCMKDPLVKGILDGLEKLALRKEAETRATTTTTTTSEKLVFSKRKAIAYKLNSKPKQQPSIIKSEPIPAVQNVRKPWEADTDEFDD